MVIARSIFEKSALVRRKYLGGIPNGSMVSFKIREAHINNDFISLILYTPGALGC